jgi:hypothetical protein
MAGSLVRGLIELITNARDSAYRLAASASNPAIGLRPIEVEVHRQPDGDRFVLRDRFEGMSADTMRRRLLQYGTTASGFDGSGLVRGLNARGAKDVGVLGTLSYESIVEDRYAECAIRQAMYRAPTHRPATREDRRRLDLVNGNGTVVTLVPFPDVRIPSFEALARDLEHHIEIRYAPPAAPRVGLAMREIRGGRIQKDRELVGYRPPGEMILEEEIRLPEYAAYGPTAKLQLFRSPTPLQVGGSAVSRFWRSEAGVLVVDGRAAHDITWFRARGAEGGAARHLWGVLVVPQIPQLLIEYEQWERQREADVVSRPNEVNPVQVTDPDRFGMNEEHPFIRLLSDRVRPYVQQALSVVEADLTAPAQERVSAELREALKSIGRKLAHALEITEGSTRGGNRIPRGLSVIPAGLRLEVGQSRKVGIYLRGDPLPDMPAVDCLVRGHDSSVQPEADVVPLEAVKNSPGLRRGFLELTGRVLTDATSVSLIAGEHSATLSVSVREPTDGRIVLDRDLQFSQRRYTSVPGRTKRIDVFADPTFVDRHVSVAVHGYGVHLAPSTAFLGLDDFRGVAVASFRATASGRALARLEARCENRTAESQVAFEPLGAEPEVRFLFTDREDFGPGRRFQWDIEAPDRLLVAGKHPTLARLLGTDLDPASGEAWPGQHAPQTRATIAEIIAEAYVARRLDRELATGSLSYGADNLVDPVEYENLRYRCFEECFLICHEALTPKFA